MLLVVLICTEQIEKLKIKLKHRYKERIWIELFVYFLIFFDNNKKKKKLTLLRYPPGVLLFNFLTSVGVDMGDISDKIEAACKEASSQLASSPAAFVVPLISPYFVGDTNMCATSVAKDARLGLCGDPPARVIVTLLLRAGEECMTNKERAVSSSSSSVVSVPFVVEEDDEEPFLLGECGARGGPILLDVVGIDFIDGGAIDDVECVVVEDVAVTEVAVVEDDEDEEDEDVVVVLDGDLTETEEGEGALLEGLIISFSFVLEFVFAFFFSGSSEVMLERFLREEVTLGGVEGNVCGILEEEDVPLVLRRDIFDKKGS